MSRIARRTQVLRALLSIGICGVLCACGRPPRSATQPPAATPVPQAVVEHFRIDPLYSQVLVLVYRDGPMAALGHNHVIAVRELSGELDLAVDPAGSSFLLRFPVRAMVVDDAMLRAAQGSDFQSPINDADIRGTREHMLGERLLDAGRFSTIELQSVSLSGADRDWHVQVRVQVREHSALIDVPVSLTRQADELRAHGEFDLSHASLGLTPYSVALGALRVAQTMHVRYELLARRAPAPPSDTLLQQ